MGQELSQEVVRMSCVRQIGEKGADLEYFKVASP